MKLKREFPAFQPKMNLLIKASVCVLAFIMVFIFLSTIDYLFFKRSEPLIPFSFVYPVLAAAFAYFVSYIGGARISSKVFAISMGSVAFLVSLFIALKAHSTPFSDFSLLNELAVSLKDGNMEKLQSNSYFLTWAYQSFFVVYQAAVMKIFPFGITPLLVCNALFLSGIVTLIYLISRKIFSERAARFIALLYFLYPSPYLLASVLTNQHISLFFVLLSIYVFMLRQSIAVSAAAGVLLALGNALRPDASLLVISVITFLAVMLTQLKGDNLKGKLLAFIKSAAPFILSVTCCFIVGAIISQAIILSGVNPNGQKNMDPQWKFVLGLNSKTHGGYSGEMAKRVFTIEDINERRRVEKEIISEHLSDKRTLLRTIKEKATFYWGTNDTSYWAFRGQNERHIPIVNKPLSSVLRFVRQTERVFFMMVVLLVIASLAAAIKKKEIHPVILISGILIFVFFMTYLFIECQARYKYFIFPFFFLVAGIVSEQIFKRRESEQ